MEDVEAVEFVVVEFVTRLANDAALALWLCRKRL